MYCIFWNKEDSMAEIPNSAIETSYVLNVSYLQNYTMKEYKTKNIFANVSIISITYLLLIIKLCKFHIPIKS